MTFYFFSVGQSMPMCPVHKLCLPLSSSSFEGAGGFPSVRASNEGLFRPGVVRAQGIVRPPCFPFFFLYSSSAKSYWRGWPRLPSTARIGRALVHRARSASKEGTWPLPIRLFQLVPRQRAGAKEGARSLMRVECRRNGVGSRDP